jgi:hypothetical protein
MSSGYKLVCLLTACDVWHITRSISWTLKIYTIFLAFPGLKISLNKMAHSYLLRFVYNWFGWRGSGAVLASSGWGAGFKPWNILFAPRGMTSSCWPYLAGNSPAGAGLSSFFQSQGPVPAADTILVKCLLALSHGCTQHHIHSVQRRFKIS